jgi:carboxymethylenebutenolidase
LVLAVAALLSLLVSPAAATSSSLMVGTRHNVRAILITPDDAGSHPGALILHAGGGLRTADLDYAQRLAKQGFVCLVPAFAATYGIPADRSELAFTEYAAQIYADLADALDVLRKHEQVADGKLAAVGFSLGGYFAVWLAATRKVEAAVTYYGALNANNVDVPMARFRSVFNNGSAPVLILHGTADAEVPVQAARHLAFILSKAQVPHVLQLYRGAGHLFDRRQISAADRAAAEDSWQQTLRFLGQYVKQH